MNYELEIRDTRSTVEARPCEQQGSWEISIDGEVHNLRLEQIGAGRLHLRHGGRWLECWVVRTARGTWVWTEGRARRVGDASGQRRGASSGQGQQVTPSMPAVVVGVKDEPGQQVDSGQALLVISAMKMETTLVAPYAGTVRSVNTEIGARVTPGDVLVQIDADEESTP